MASDLGRRGFLSLLGGGIVGLTLAETLPKWLVHEPAKLFKPSLATLDALTAAILKEFELRIDRGSRIMPEPNRKMGPDWQHWQSQGLELLPMEEMNTYERLVIPMADSLADTVKRERLNVFGKLALPLAGAQGSLAVSERAAIRGVCQYHIGTDRSYLRFDILGSHA